MAVSKSVVGLSVMASIFMLTGTTSAPAVSRFDLSAQKKRPHVTIYPRHVRPGPNAKRQCYSWLVKEYRVSGPVIVPQMRCWWE
jgi:hypothetical protein